MKLDSARIDQLLTGLESVRAVLLHGDDEGLVRELGHRLVVSVAGSTDDPFQVSDVDRDKWGQLADEVAAQSLLGGRRVVRVRDATDAVTTHVERALKISGGGLLVLEGPGLGSRSKLKTVVERDTSGVTVACYPMDDKAVAQLARSIFRDARIAVEADAVTWLADRLGADRGLTRRELEKVALYVGEGGSLDMEAARVCVGDLSGLSLDDAVFAATAGNVAATDRALELAMAEGATPVSVIRTALSHLQRLTRAATLVAQGAAPGTVVKSVRPPIHFKREGEFSRALALWPLASLQMACARLWDTERACKRTGSPAEVLCRSVILGLAQRAAVARRR